MKQLSKNKILEELEDMSYEDFLIQIKKFESNDYFLDAVLRSIYYISTQAQIPLSQSQIDNLANINIHIIEILSNRKNINESYSNSLNIILNNKIITSNNNYVEKLKTIINNYINNKNVYNLSNIEFILNNKLLNKFDYWNHVYDFIKNGQICEKTFAKILNHTHCANNINHIINECFESCNSIYLNMALDKLMDFNKIKILE